MSNLKTFMIKFNNFIECFGAEKLILIFLIGFVVAIFSILGTLSTIITLLMYIIIGGLFLLSNIEFKFFDKKTYLYSIICGIISGFICFLLI